MPEQNLHAVQVRAWIKASTKNLSEVQLISHFENSFSLLWNCARKTISVFTLTAILDRALFYTTENFPVLSSLKVQVTGLSFSSLKAQKGLKSKDLIEGFEHLLIEFLTITGKLTGEIITPCLYEELFRISPDKKLSLTKKRGK
jgi:hypothetical protein